MVQIIIITTKKNGLFITTSKIALIKRIRANLQVSLKNRKGGKKRRSEESEVTKFIKQPKNDFIKKTKPRKIRETKDGAPKRDGKGRKPRNRASANSEDEDEEKCASAACVQPLGEEVHWIQCDGGCELWFHMACVGLSQKDINEEDDYICTACTRGSCKDSLSASIPNECSDELPTEEALPVPTEITC